MAQVADQSATRLEPCLTCEQTLASETNPRRRIGNSYVSWKSKTSQAEAEVARLRFAFLAEASRLLTASLDSDLTLEALTRYVVPVLADVCVVDLIDDESQDVRRVAVACASSMASDLARRLRSIGPKLNATSGVGRVLTGGESVLCSDVTEDQLAELDATPEAMEILRALAPVSALIVPLRTRGKTMAAMTLLSTDSARRYVDSDMTLACDLADRAAIALDNGVPVVIAAKTTDIGSRKQR